MMQPTRPMTFSADDFVVVLTGAGVSAESGIQTFRDAGGLWENHDVYEIASPEGFRRDPEKVWRFYMARRDQAREHHPNPAHRALAALEARLGDRMLLVTQNVDGLHRRAGSRRVVEIHGNLFRSKCTSIGCDGYITPWDDPISHQAGMPTCPHCGSLARPDIVWFGELLNRRDLRTVEEAAVRCTVFVAIGTSGAVYPAAGLAHAARHAGARTVLVNKDPAENLDDFDTFVQGKAGETLPALFGVSVA